MYRFQFEYSSEDLLVLNQVSIKAYLGWTRVFWPFVAVIGLLSVIFSIVEWDSYRMFGVFFLPCGVFVLILWLMQWLSQRSLGVWFSKRMLVRDAGEQTLTLEEDGLRGQDRKGEGLTRWDAFADGFYSRERYLLFIDRNHGYVLPKQALIEGDVTTLKAFLEEKLGKEIKEIR